MRFASSAVGGTTEILAADDFVGIPITVQGAEVVKAGQPLKKDGSKADEGTDAIGILLYDVNPNENPNGTVVVQGVIDTKKVKASSSVDLTSIAEALKTALPGIILRDNIGVNSEAV